MKNIIIVSFFLSLTLSASGQKISFPTPEMRVDTLRGLSSAQIVLEPTEVLRSLTINATNLPPTFLMQAIDSIGYRRFAVSRNGLFISGTGHDPAVNVDGLALIGRNNRLKGADSFAFGKGVVNTADTAGAFGYHFTQSKNNTLTIGYKGNRIEFSGDSGRFIGKWKLGSGSGGIANETDPTVPNHVKSITAANLTNWNNAFGWGNHATQGYLKSYTETDPTIGSHIKNITAANVTNWNSTFGWGNHTTAGYLKTETDPAWTAAKSSYYTQVQTKTLVKDTAAVLRGLIKVAAGGGITSESDPTVPAHVKSLTVANLTNWNNAFGWGNHAAQGYLKTYTETDPTIGTHIKGITVANVTNWNSAFGWGNHTTAGYLKTETDPVWTAAKSGYYTQTETKALVKDTAAVLRGLIPKMPVLPTLPGNNILYNKSGQIAALPGVYANGDGSTTYLEFRPYLKINVNQYGTLFNATFSNANANLNLLPNGFELSSEFPISMPRSIGSVTYSDQGILLQEKYLASGTVVNTGELNVRKDFMSYRKRGRFNNIQSQPFAVRMSDSTVYVRHAIKFTTDRQVMYPPVSFAEISTREDASMLLKDANGQTTLAELIGKGQIITQAAEPTLADNSFAFWVNGGSFYLILRANGTQKKIQLQ